VATSEQTSSSLAGAATSAGSQLWFPTQFRHMEPTVLNAAACR
jgi:hypothetical protein